MRREGPQLPSWIVKTCTRDEDTLRRELTPLRRIGDEYRKVVVVLDGAYPSDVDGIEIVGAIDFFLHR